ncbi:MAG: Ig-like domain-containing protein, partial [Candidatus Thermoplasmatota archaeon]|nr:Ig-like domain-containing protein [Candidatus Thermoplasmatota archaeon]
VGYVEISKNDGNTWTTSETITGTSGGSWEEIWIPLNAFLLEVIKIRFRFISDDSDTAEGWYIDDVRIIAKIDETPPTSTAKIDSGTMGENDWFTSNVVVSISATDEESGVKDIFFKLNGGPQQPYTAPISLTQDGQHTIEYWAVDNVGNIEPVNTFSVKIDKTNPETPVILRPDAGIYLRDRKIWPLIKFSLFNWTPPRVFGAITVSVETSDATSGVNNVAFFIDDDFMDQVETTPYEWVWDETVFFKHTLTVRVTDNAGNTAETSKEIIIFNLNLFG